MSDGNGCGANANINVDLPTQLTLSKEISNISCPGLNTGAINLTVSGGISPYIFIWSNDSTSEDLNSLKAGIYIVSVSDSNNCIVTDSISVTEPDIPSTKLKDVFCNLGNVELTDTLLADSVNGASSYDFYIFNNYTGYSYIYSNSIPLLPISQIPDLLNDYIYTVQVRIDTGTCTTSYGESCFFSLFNDPLNINEAPIEYRDYGNYSNFIKVKFKNSDVINASPSNPVVKGTNSIKENYPSLRFIFEDYIARGSGNNDEITFKRNNIDQYLDNDKVRNIYNVYFPVLINFDSLTTDLRNNPFVDAISEPSIISLTGVPFNDPGSQNNPYPNWYLEQIQAPEAWVFLQNIQDPILVGIIDGGRVATSHPEIPISDIVNIFQYGSNEVRDHPTEVASIICADNNNTGVISVANDILQISSHSLVGSNESLPPANTELFQLSSLSSILNLSFVYRKAIKSPDYTYRYIVFNDYSEKQVDLLILEGLQDAGVLLCAATGNFMSAGYDMDYNFLDLSNNPEHNNMYKGIGYPFGLPGVIGVGGTAKDYTGDVNFEYGMGSGNVIMNTNQAITSGGNYNYNIFNPLLPTTSNDYLFQQEGYLDIVAPSKFIDVAGFDLASHQATIKYDAGTSLASPIVASIVASMKAVNSNLSNTELFNILTETADKVGYNPNGLVKTELNTTVPFTKGYTYTNVDFNDNNLDYIMGHGRVNMLSAVMNAASKITGGFTISNTLPYHQITVNNINEQSYLTNNYFEPYEYDAILNQESGQINFTGTGSIFELSSNSTFRISNSAKMAFENGSELKINSGDNGQSTKLIIENNPFTQNAGVLTLESGSICNLTENSLLSVEINGNLNIYNTLNIESGATLHVSGAISIGATGQLIIQDGAYLCIETGASVTNSGSINISDNCIIGTNPLLNQQNQSTSCSNLCAFFNSSNYSGSGSLAYNNTCLDLTSATVVTNVSCAGNDGSIIVDVQGGTSPYTYLWSNSQTTQSINNLTAGNFTVTVYDSSNPQTSNTFSFTVSNSVAISITTSTTDVYCQGGINSGTATINVTGGVQPYTYLWSNDQTSLLATNLSVGTYDVTVTDINGCTTNTSVQIINDPDNLPISIVLHPTNMLCYGGYGSVWATVTGGSGQYSEFCTNSLGEPVPLLYIPASGSYLYTTYDSNGCMAAEDFNIFDNTVAINISISKIDATTCNASNGFAIVNATGGVPPYTYQWSNFQPTQSINNLTQGIYNVSVFDANDCYVTGSVVIENAGGFSLDFNVAEISCYGANDGAINTSVSSGTSPYTYTWSTTESTQNISGLSEGSYSLTVYDSNNNCQTNSYTLSEPNFLYVTLSSDEYMCNGRYITVESHGGTEPYTYIWDNDIIGSTGFYSTPGSYSVTVTDAHGCTDNYDNLFYETHDFAFDVSITNATGCGNTNGSAQITDYYYGSAPFTYLWSNSTTNNNVTNVIAGNYTVTVTSDEGCESVQDVIIANDNSPVFIIDKTDVLCNGVLNSGSATVIPANSDGNYSYLWSNSQTTQTITNLSEGSYSVTITDNVSGSCSIGYITINISAPLDLILSSTQITNTNPPDGTATVTIVGGTSPYTFLWSDGQTTQTATGLTGGYYTVTVTDANGCFETGTLFINYAVGISHWPYHPQNGTLREHGRQIVSIDNTVIASGWFTENITFDNFSFSTNNPLVSGNSYLVWFDNYANVITAKHFRSNDNNSVYIRSLTLNSFGELIVAGEANGNLIIDNSTPITINGSFILKYSNTGLLYWIKSLPMSNGRITGITTEGTSGIYITGYFHDNSITIPGSATITNNGGYDYFVAKLNNSGVFQWAHNNNCTANHDFAEDIAYGNDKVFITGSSDDKIFIKSFNKNTGALIYEKNNYSNSNGHANAIEFSTNDGYPFVYIAGSASNQIYVSKANDYIFGNIWEKICGDPTGSLGNIATDIVVDNNGYAYVTGQLRRADFPMVSPVFSFTSIFPSHNNFIAKFDKDYPHDPLWVETSGGTDSESTYSITRNQNGNLFVTGEFTGDATFGNTTLSAYYGTTDAFIARVVEESGIGHYKNLFLSTDSITNIKNNEYSIAPNPTTGILSINSNNLIQKITVYDLVGSKIKEVDNIKNYITTLDLNTLSNAIYYIKIETVNDVYTEKIIKIN